MKKFLLLISLWLVSCFSVSLSAQIATITVTLETALQLAQNKFSGKDYDYYKIENGASNDWEIFIDANPGANWEHECYVYRVRKISLKSQGLITSLTSAKMPPTEKIIFLSGTKTNGVNVAYDTSKPRVTYSPNLVSTPDSIRNRTYALIISGGYQKEINDDRYWNDCSFIYQTLSKRYRIPKDHLFPIMADGDDPTEDTHVYNLYEEEYCSQDLDIDNDGNNEIQLAATKNNIQATLRSLQSKMNKDDHLLIFVIDHGGSEDGKTSYICLWNQELLYDFELATYLEPFTKNFVNVNVILGQCAAGGFIDDLQKIGCVVTAACGGDECSFGCTDKNYDEFVYNWTTAINRGTHKNSVVLSDVDKNGYVSMEEAFLYALENDKCSETPLFSSNPASVGQDLAFNHLAKSVDLYIRDTEEDTGVEPNTQAPLFWKSPSVWVRNQPDSVYMHENPIYSTNHRDAFIYVKVENRGREDYKGGKFLHTYWAQASTGLTAKAWKGREVYTDPEDGYQNVTGGHLEPRYIPPLKAGQDTIIEVTWTLPSAMERYPEGNFHYCLYTKIMDTVYDDGYQVGKENTYFTPRESNDQAQKNVTIIKSSGLGVAYKVYVRNTNTSATPYTLELVPQTASDAYIFTHATVQMTMSQKLYDAWSRGGNLSQNVTVLSAPERRVRFNSPDSKLQGINLNGSEFDILQLKFTFKPLTTQSRTYTLDLIQKDEAGNIIGGQTFVVTSPGSNLQPILPINSTRMNDNQFELSVDEEDIVTMNWTNQRDEEIGNAESVTVKGEYEPMTYTATAYYEDGTMATGSITIEASTGIESWQVANDRQKIFVKLFGSVPENAYICLVSLADGSNQPSEADAASSDMRSIDISNLPAGNYAITYIVDGVTIDQKKIQL